jgi:hypothetical protein
VQGLAGNLAVVVQNSPTRMIRDGLLMHTGEWPGWNTSMPMPNSHGCMNPMTSCLLLQTCFLLTFYVCSTLNLSAGIHGHPLDIMKVNFKLTDKDR